MQCVMQGCRGLHHCMPVRMMSTWCTLLAWLAGWPSCCLPPCTLPNQIPELAEMEVGLANFFIQHTSCSLTINENASPDGEECVFWRALWGQWQHAVNAGWAAGAHEQGGSFAERAVGGLPPQLPASLLSAMQLAYSTVYECTLPLLP